MLDYLSVCFNVGLAAGRLKQALGMHEPKAAQLVGIHPGSVSWGSSSSSSSN
jgi:hypothetical protein